MAITCDRIIVMAINFKRMQACNGFPLYFYYQPHNFSWYQDHFYKKNARGPSKKGYREHFILVFALGPLKGT